METQATHSTFLNLLQLQCILNLLEEHVRQANNMVKERQYETSQLTWA